MFDLSLNNSFNSQKSKIMKVKAASKISHRYATGTFELQKRGVEESIFFFP